MATANAEIVRVLTECIGLVQNQYNQATGSPMILVLQELIDQYDEPRFKRGQWVIAKRNTEDGDGYDWAAGSVGLVVKTDCDDADGWTIKVSFGGSDEDEGGPPVWCIGKDFKVTESPNDNAQG
jgi:hypothetical protein